MHDECGEELQGGFCAAGSDGAPVLWVYVSDGHYQLAVPRQEVGLMRPSPDATPPRGTGNVGEYFFLLPTGGVFLAGEKGNACEAPAEM